MFRVDGSLSMFRQVKCRATNVPQWMARQGHSWLLTVKENSL